MSRSLHELSAVALAQQYRAGTLSPVEATQAVLDRIAKCEDKVNAMYFVTADDALETAKAAEARYRAGEPLGPMDGVPITVKDIIASAGHPTPSGTGAADLDKLETDDAPPTARVKEAGCVIVGKTTMPDLGMLSSGVSSLHGTTRNPWDLSRNTGGSSSGAGAALGLVLRIFHRPRYAQVALLLERAFDLRRPAACSRTSRASGACPSIRPIGAARRAR